MKKYCVNCGNEVNENAAFCLSCGVSLTNNQENNNKISNNPGKGLSIAGLILGIISLIIAIIIFFI